MAEIIEREYPKKTERTEDTYVYTLTALHPGDTVLPPVKPSDYPLVRRTVTDELEGSVTLKLTETEAAVVRAVLGRTNGRGNLELGKAAYAVYCALDGSDIQADYIKILDRDGKSVALSPQYGKDDRVYA